MPTAIVVAPDIDLFAHHSIRETAFEFMGQRSYMIHRIALPEAIAILNVGKTPNHSTQGYRGERLAAFGVLPRTPPS